jgi:hypothetical protein
LLLLDGFTLPSTCHFRNSTLPLPKGPRNITCM